MATTQTYSLFTVPFNHTTDFTELADNCERFADVLIESDDEAEKMALCGRLSACLALLHPTLREPIPDYLKASLTVDDLPTHTPAFMPEIDQLSVWCQSLTQLLMSGSLATTQVRVLGELLHELVCYFADTLKAPRWLNTEAGMLSLEDLH
ncbi:hypothetical protein QMG90_00645 [Trabulsiella odontotermitis]|uniref:hypothetical protein n=1 Tax=Trabulsiella odontotermitis TaxID=379893 RepID=UPI0024B7A417|nr:hypothetical protein [Trabulsiella odontotermitis]WHP31493.1 hypothetical protein QMG90_00645 [Trabulsiella odontotermitis]